MNGNEKKEYLKLTLENVMSDDFGKYAKYIIQDRALPDIRDGLKPVQRRIIYAMNNLHLFYDQPHKKSARTVGEVIGKYHPHGDSSIYEAMVRMSQSWKNNITLLDMHGNNGSIDGDGAAAMRYTECRLSKFGQTMTKNLEKNTVQFINNFDDSELEPVVLPTLLPNLLINGANGIAAGYATNIPTFNPSEVIEAIITRIDSPNCFLKSILNVMPGPDFPTGGIILNPQGIVDAYTTGKGKINIRGEIKLLNAKTAIITSIPYETNKSLIIRQLDELKAKYDVLNIKEVRDETDKNGVRIVLELANGKNFELMKNIIYKETEMQISYTLNMVAIDNHKPLQFSILNALDSFITHINQIIVAACKYDLERSLKRKEIVEGLIKAIRIIDDVVEIIRHANNKEDAKQSIIDHLSFTNLQAEAIVNLRLYRLSNTDVSSLKEELNQLITDIEQFKLLIENKQYRNNYIKNQLRDYKKEFGYSRKSVISHENEKIQIDENDTIDDRKMVIISTRDGYLKSVSLQTYSNIEYKTIKIKNGDLPVCQFISNQRDKTILITSYGNFISIPTFKIEQIKWKDIGIHINTLINISPDEKIIYGFNYDNNINDPRCLVLVTARGMIKRTLIKDLGISRLIKISKIIQLNADKLVGCLVLPNETDDINIGIINNLGYGYATKQNQISLVSKNACGVKAMNMMANTEIVGIINYYDSNTNDTILFVSQNGMKRIHITDLPIQNRPSKGVSLVNQPKSNISYINNVYLSKKNDVIQYVDDTNNLQFINSSEIPLGNRDTRISKITSSKINLATIFNFNSDNNQINSHITNKLIKQENNKIPKTLFDIDNEDK